MTLAIDGTGNNTAGSSFTVAASLTTASTSDYIIACVRYQAAAVTSVVGGTLGALTQIASQVSGTDNCAIYAKLSAGTLASEIITVTQNQAFDIAVDVFGVSGSNQTSLVFDAGGPVTAGSSPQNFTTVNADTMLISVMDWFIAAPGAGTGFTAIPGSNVFGILSQYKILSAAGTTSIGSGNDGLVNAFAAIAIVQSAGVIAAVPYNPWPLRAPLLAQ